MRAAHAFATLGHPGRRAVFRRLMRFAPRGMRPTEIAEALGLKPNTLSHHLADLTASALVGVERQGRSLSDSVDFDRTDGFSAPSPSMWGAPGPVSWPLLLFLRKDAASGAGTLPISS